MITTNISAITLYYQLRVTSLLYRYEIFFIIRIRILTSLYKPLLKVPKACHNYINRMKPRNDFQKVTDKHTDELLFGPKFIFVSCMNWSNNNEARISSLPDKIYFYVGDYS